ncbi:MAG: hypothetical protein HXY20_00065 [Acidobacteria bacterium]|nr:hypothetical protein [Acidobacteriota bacterium]
MKRNSRSGTLAASALRESGFSLVEFLISTLVLLLVATAVFAVLAETQRAASYQTEVQAVMDNSRVALETLERILRQAGNNPQGAALTPITIISPTEVQVQSDLTGSVPPDRGDPDGQIDDPGENLTIRYNAGNRTIELIPNGGSAMPVANYISAFTIEWFDALGAATVNGAAATRARIRLTATTAVPNPQTRQIFGMQQACDVLIQSRL